MRTLALAFLAVAVMLLGTPVGSAFAACALDIVCSGPPHYSGAPGPIVGAGLPVLAVIGGAYYVVRRRRRNKG
jgi:hypothetical protein